MQRNSKILAIWLFSHALGYCDTPDTSDWILAASTGHVFFAMYGPTEGTLAANNGRGFCYRLEAEGKLRKLWEVSGWYMSSGLLSESGKYLVRFGPWASDKEGHSDLAVAFYKNGKLIKQYQVNELIKNTDRLENSASHYSWLAAQQSYPNTIEGSELTLTMIDGTVYCFDLDTGGIVDTDVDPHAAGQSLIEREHFNSRNE